MVDTTRTISYLTGTSFPTNGVGGITAQNVRDHVVTMQARTSGIVRVTDPEFGADPTGVSDSTTAFQNAMAAGVALVPSVTSAGAQAKYLLNNCIVPSGGQLIGFNPLVYIDGTRNPSQVYARPLILPLNGSTARIFNVDSHYGILLQGLAIDATGIATGVCDGVSAGGRSMTLRDLSITGMRFGIGGQVSGSTAVDPQACRITQMYNCQVTYCVTGVGDLVDAWVIGCTFTTSGNGWLTTTSGSGAVTLIGSRFEECGSSEYPRFNGPVSGWGVQTLNGCNDVIFSGCYFDMNGNGGASIGGGWTTFTGCEFQRNGFNPTANGGTTLISASCHLQLNGAIHVAMNGCIMHDTLADWGSVSVYCPAAAVNFVGSASNNKAIVLVGNDLSGFQGSTAGASLTGPSNSNTTWFTGTLPTGTGVNAIIVKANIGTGTAAQDVDTR